MLPKPCPNAAKMGVTRHWYHVLATRLVTCAVHTGDAVSGTTTSHAPLAPPFCVRTQKPDTSAVPVGISHLTDTSFGPNTSTSGFDGCGCARRTSRSTVVAAAVDGCGCARRTSRSTLVAAAGRLLLFDICSGEADRYAELLLVFLKAGPLGPLRATSLHKLLRTQSRHIYSYLFPLPLPARVHTRSCLLNLTSGGASGEPHV